MATNVAVDSGNHLPMQVPIGTKSGDPLTFVDVPCVALTDRRPDGRATVMFGGVVKVFVVVNNPSKSGDMVYYDDTIQTKLIAESGGSRTKWGVMRDDHDVSGDALVKVLWL
jgi:predicted RecA/RadA family phage recombinase